MMFSSEVVVTFAGSEQTFTERQLFRKHLTKNANFYFIIRNSLSVKMTARSGFTISLTDGEILFLVIMKQAPEKGDRSPRL